MSKSSKLKQSRQTKKAIRGALGDFIENRYLSMAIALLVELRGTELSELVAASHGDLLDRIFVWQLTLDLDTCFSPNSLLFPTKEEFIQKLCQEDPKPSRYLIEAIRKLSSTNRIKIATFTQVLEDEEIQHVLNIGEINLPKPKSPLVSIANLNPETLKNPK